jgi:hypothetical protein
MAMSRSQLARPYLIWLRALASFLLVVPAAACVVVFFLPRRQSLLASPLVITLIALAMGLWFAFSAGRDARSRLDGIKHGFATTGNLKLLLRDYLLVYLVVLLRLQALTLCGFLTAIWGKGPAYAVAFMVVAMLLTARAWPTQHKLDLLLDRVGIKS